MVTFLVSLDVSQTNCLNVFPVNLATLWPAVFTSLCLHPVQLDHCIPYQHLSIGPHLYIQTSPFCLLFV